MSAPAGFHLLAKPTGATCNLDCRYCFFLSKDALYPGNASRMSDETLEAYVRQLFESHRTPRVGVSWQGGEPTLMKLEFFERAMQVVEKYRRPGQTVEHTIQTNGVLLDEAWCAFFRKHRFLVGLSIDGPREIHDAYRVNRGGAGTFDSVMRGWRLLRDHGVDVNILCTIHAANQDRGRLVYTFFRDRLDARWIQFIPIVERATAETLEIANRGWSAEPGGKRLLYTQAGSLVTGRSIAPAAYGQFLVDVFEEWVRHDVGRVYVQLFDVTLDAIFGRHTLCVHAPTCGDALALEHNGDLYSCDHFVEPQHLLGNIHETHMATLVGSTQQRGFGEDKLRTLTRQCRECGVRALCNGGCPKDRFVLSRDGEEGHNYLCAGLERFFTHVRPSLEWMAQQLERQQPPAAIMDRVNADDAKRGPYHPCSCGGGRKFRFCHGASPGTAPS